MGGYCWSRKISNNHFVLLKRCSWDYEIEKNAADNVCKILIGNKIDMDNKRAVTYDEGKQLADSLGMKFWETSSKTSSNVEQSFQTLATDIKSKQAKTSISGGNNAFTRPKDLRNVQGIG